MARIGADPSHLLRNTLSESDSSACRHSCAICHVDGDVGQPQDLRVGRDARSSHRTVEERYPAPEQRRALIFYRDQGDEYVTRVFDFQTDVE